MTFKAEGPKHAPLLLHTYIYAFKLSAGIKQTKPPTSMTLEHFPCYVSNIKKRLYSQEPVEVFVHFCRCYSL